MTRANRDQGRNGTQDGATTSTHAANGMKSMDLALDIAITAGKTRFPSRTNSKSTRTLSRTPGAASEVLALLSTLVLRERRCAWHRGTEGPYDRAERFCAPDLQEMETQFILKPPRRSCTVPDLFVYVVDRPETKQRGQRKDRRVAIDPPEDFEAQGRGHRRGCTGTACEGSTRL